MFAAQVRLRYLPQPITEEPAIVVPGNNLRTGFAQQLTTRVERPFPVSQITGAENGIHRLSMQKLEGDVQEPVFSMNIANQSDSSYRGVDLVT
jgi:hypothetical protein